MIRTDLTNKQYHEVDAISSTDAKAVVLSTIYHWHHQERRETPAMQKGTAVHDFALEGGNNTVCGPETRRGNAWKDAVAEAGDKLLLPEAEYFECQSIAAALRADPACAKQLDHPSALQENSLFATCYGDTLKVKARPDSYNPDDFIMSDVKVTVDPSPTGFVREIYKYRYDVQAAFYKYVASLVGWEIAQFAFLAVSNTKPYVAHLHVMSLESMKRGENDMFKALNEISEAKQNNSYTTGWPRFSMAYPPSWMTE